MKHVKLWKITLSHFIVISIIDINTGVFIFKNTALQVYK